MSFWLVVLLLMSSSLRQSDDSSEQVERQLFDAMRKLDALKSENKKLKDIANELRRLKSLADKKTNVGEALLNPKHDDNIWHLTDNDNGSDSVAVDEPSLLSEVSRRAAENGVVEFWYYITAQLSHLKSDMSGQSSSIDQQWINTKLEKLTDILSTSADYKRSVMRDFRNMTKASDAWRNKEAKALAALIQRRLHMLQNPADCRSARKLLCNINKGCGFGCQLHHIAYCFIVAYGTNRTLIVMSRGWRYSPTGGWDKYFLPVSNTCQDRTANTGSAKMWTANVDNIQVVEMPIIDSIHPRPPYMPQAVPADIADRLIRLHGHPFVWWMGQFVSYLLRLQPWLVTDIEKMTQKLDFYGPIVGIHVRRTDKVGSEAAFHDIDEYMVHVEDYFLTLDKLYSSVKRRVYIATDDPSVIDETKRKYPEYDVIGDTTLSKTAGLSNRYSDDSLRAVILDIHFLSQSDYLVCTFSSQVCRLAYELMQTLHADASRRFRSLDDVYYFGGQNAHYQVALVEHKARPGTDELDLLPGDGISVAGNHWDGFSKGRCERTGKLGIYPSYKVREHVDIVNFPIYLTADTDTS